MTENEQKLKETIQRQKQCLRDADTIMSESDKITTEVLRLEAAIAAEKKPKHGDVRWINPRDPIIFIDGSWYNFGCSVKLTGRAWDNRGTFQYNLKDEIKQLAKGPLKEFKVRNITASIMTNGDLIMTHDVPGTSWIVPKELVDEFIMNLRCLQETRKAQK